MFKSIVISIIANIVWISLVWKYSLIHFNVYDLLMLFAVLNIGFAVTYKLRKLEKFNLMRIQNKIKNELNEKIMDLNVNADIFLSLKQAFVERVLIYGEKLSEDKSFDCFFKSLELMRSLENDYSSSILLLDKKSIKYYNQRSSSLKRIIDGLSQVDKIGNSLVNNKDIKVENRGDIKEFISLIDTVRSEIKR